MTNEEIKTIYFSQYLYQTVYQDIEAYESRGFIDKLKITPYILENGLFVKNGMLLLRTIEQLNFDETFSIAKSIGWSFSNNNDEATILNHVQTSLINARERKPYKYKDVLRLYGVIVPFTYLDRYDEPETVSEADLIEFGFCKIQPTK